MPNTLEERQHRVLTRAQLIALGNTRGHLAAQVAANRWVALTPTLYVLHNGPLTKEQQWWAATLAAGPLAGRSALEAWGVTGWVSDAVEVIVKRGDRPVLPQGVAVKVHESRRFSQSDVVDRFPPRMRLERAAVDAAAWSQAERAACGVLAAVVQQRRTTAARLLAELNAAGRVRHGALLRRVLRDIEGGAQALSEVDLGRVCERAGLELVGRQVVRKDGEGRRRYVDARVRSRETGRTVLIEVDGALHLIASSYWEDMRRGNELVISGDRVLRFPTIALWLDEHVVRDQLRRSLGLPTPGQGAAA